MSELARFFESDYFMPHGHCFLWRPEILWLHVLSDSAIVFAYYTIPLALAYLVWKRKDLPFGIVFWLFAAFILLCGTTHLLSIWVLWHPDYGPEGLVKAATGIVSLATLAVTVKLLPKALLVPSPAQLAALNTELRTNIAERDDAQAALKNAYNVMEKRVEERTRELSVLLGKLKRSNEELEEFAHIVSHDLKEPLRGLSNRASFLLSDYGDKLGGEGTAHLERLVELTASMERLIEDLLNFSRLGHIEFAVRDSDPNLIVRDVTQMMDGYLKEHRAAVTIPAPMPRVVCDATRITEVFRNLITNAVKYNDKEQKTVEVGHLKRVDSETGPVFDVFYVRDNGIGIAPEFHEEIFRIFKRLNEEVDTERGTGAGLTFVRKIIERHGGRIWLTSVPGEGTTFYFTVKPGDDHVST